MYQPFFSIIIPTRRKNNVLRRCLNSLFKQDYPQNRFEIILVSQKKLKFADGRKIVNLIGGTNHAEARNIAASRAKGEILAFCDDDCILPRGWLSSASSFFVNQTLDLIGGPVVPPKRIPFAFKVGAYLAGSKFVVGPSAARWRILYAEGKANPFNLILANTFLRKKSFEEVGGFDSSQVPGEENLLYYKLQQKGAKLLYTPKIACFHPSKPIFLPLTRKVFFYSTGRGVLLAKEPRTFHYLFWLPTLFVVSLVFLPAFALFFRPALWLLGAMLASYWFLNLAQTLYIFWFRERDLRIFWAVPIATFLLHTSYGLGLLRGFLWYKLGKKSTFLMPKIEKA